MRDSRMLVKADARSMGAVTPTDVRATPRWQGSKASDFTSACVSYTEDSDGNPHGIHVFTTPRKHISRKVAAVKNERKERNLYLQSLAGNNSEVD